MTHGVVGALGDPLACFESLLLLLVSPLALFGYDARPPAFVNVCSEFLTRFLSSGLGRWCTGKFSRGARGWDGVGENSYLMIKRRKVVSVPSGGESAVGLYGLDCRVVFGWRGAGEHV